MGVLTPPCGSRRHRQHDELRRAPPPGSHEDDPGALAGYETDSGHELEAVTAVFDQQLVWDAANNLVRQVDHRDPGEWPAGYRPQSVDIRHDSLYRVIGAEYEYTQTDGSRTTSDTLTDWRTNFNESSGAGIDPMEPEPAGIVTDSASGRVVSLAWDWDYLANQTAWTDDQSQFYERSIGDITNGNALGGGERPSALYLSSDIDSGAGGWLELDYGAGGNVEAMTVHGQCVSATNETCADPGGTDLAARRTALRTGCSCAVEQHYAYAWDELNRIVEARRYDFVGPDWQLEARERYRYDGANQRVIKQSLEQDTCSSTYPVSATTPCERVALYPYPGDFERRGLYADTTSESYEPTGAGTETQYMVAGARVVWAEPSPGAGFDRDARITVPVSDLIQTSSAVMDIRSGQLLEASTYYPNGGRETFLNNDGDLVSAELAGFTGKEADEEVGVVYFGERWLIPRVGRWASADPLHVHASGGGEALNSYHYVSGNLLAARDPLGLDGEGTSDNDASPEYVDLEDEAFGNPTRDRQAPEAPPSGLLDDTVLSGFQPLTPSQQRRLPRSGGLRISSAVLRNWEEANDGRSLVAHLQTELQGHLGIRLSVTTDARDGSTIVRGVTTELTRQLRDDAIARGQGEAFDRYLGDWSSALGDGGRGMSVVAATSSQERTPQLMNGPFAVDLEGNLVVSSRARPGRMVSSSSSSSPSAGTAMSLAVQLFHEFQHSGSVVGGRRTANEQEATDRANAVREMLGAPVRDAYPATTFRAGEDEIYQWRR